MNKEIEALNYVWYNYYTEELSQDEVKEIEKNLNIIQDGLKRLEAIDNAKPSEAISYLDSFLNEMTSKEEILKILKESPFILAKLFGNGLLKNQVDYDNKYFWGAITDSELDKVIAWLNDEELEDAVIIPKATLEHWFDLLCVNGCNSKGMVRNDIQEVLRKK